MRIRILNLCEVDTRDAQSIIYRRHLFSMSENLVGLLRYRVNSVRMDHKMTKPNFGDVEHPQNS